jgi:hypothetical protein
MRSTKTKNRETRSTKRGDDYEKVWGPDRGIHRRDRWNPKWGDEIDQIRLPFWWRSPDRSLLTSLTAAQFHKTTNLPIWVPSRDWCRCLAPPGHGTIDFFLQHDEDLQTKIDQSRETKPHRERSAPATQSTLIPADSWNETNEVVFAAAGVRINDPGGTGLWPTPYSRPHASVLALPLSLSHSLLLCLYEHYLDECTLKSLYLPHESS